MRINWHRPGDSAVLFELDSISMNFWIDHSSSSKCAWKFVPGELDMTFAFSLTTAPTLRLNPWTRPQLLVHLSVRWLLPLHSLLHLPDERCWLGRARQ